MSLQPNRKRRRSSGVATTSSNDMESKQIKPLEGAVICLTGLTQEEKDRLHALIQELGGVFTRNLISTENTHLIATELQGPKCDVAIEFDHIHIVEPAWLEACSQQGYQVDETPYSLRAGGEEEQNDATTFTEVGSVGGPTKDKENKAKSLMVALSQSLDDDKHDSNLWLFSGCQFHMVGFLHEGDNHGDTSTSPDNALVPLGRLIRRGMGTIHWELLNGAVSHIIVQDDRVDAALRDVILSMEPIPHLVSPWWVLESWKQGKLASCSSFPPIYRKKQQSKATRKSKSQINSKRAPSIFRGSLFVMIRVAPPEWAVDFNAQELEKIVVLHGGQLLSLKLVEALKTDQTAGRLDQLRKCYVVCWGSYTPDNLIHPLVTQVMRHKLCDMEHVTPIWLQTCVAEQKCLGAKLVPQIFIPNHCPLHAALTGNQNKQEHLSVSKTKSKVDESPIRVSVTGFTGYKRTALAQLVQAMGGIYDDSMRTSTTHLICRQAVGEKYNKAMEWKLFAVSEDWIYHIASYGFAGQKVSSSSSSALGCEDCFAIIAS